METKATKIYCMSHNLWTVGSWKTPQPWRWQAGPAESHSLFYLGWHLKLHGECALTFFWKTLDTFHCVSVIPSMQISYVCSALACFTTLNSSIYASFLRAPLATVDLLLCRCHLPSANGMWSHQAAGWLPHPTCVTQAHRAICSSNWWEFREIREWFYLFTPFPSTHPSLLPSILQNGELLPNQLWQGAQSPLTVYHKKDLRFSTITACT